MIASLLLHILFYFAFPPMLPGLPRAEAVVVQQLPQVRARPAVERTSSLEPPSISAQAFVVWDPASESRLAERNADHIYPIASVTKLMTATVALESGIDLDRTMTITSDDNDPEGSRVPLPVGSIVTNRDLLFATLISSANNAAEALARASGLTESTFVARMNAKAAELGLPNTRFTDVTGLGATNTSSADDLVQLAMAAFAHPEITEATTTKTYEVRDRAKTVRIENTDKLVVGDLHITGGKTGYTDAARGALVSRIRGIGDREVIIVVLESAGREQRFADVHALADWTFATHTWRTP